MLHLLPPELTERYEPADILGYGAFAMVVKARDKTNNQMVAIKHLQTKQGDKKKFFRELNLSTRLRHPNIVRCLDVYASNDQSSDMVFEFADQGMLRTYLPEGEPFDFAQTLKVIADIVLGLDYAHSQGVVHRDLKPENILVFSNPEKKDELIYKIADFGVAKLLGPSKKTATSIGSPSYMAPEQFYDSYDLSSDVYAVGIIFYELMHGFVPFSGSAAEIFKGHLEGTLNYRDELHPEIKKLIHEMLLKTPGARPKAKEVFQRIQKIAQTFDLQLDAQLSDTPDELITRDEEKTTGFSIFSDFDGDDSTIANSTTTPSTNLSDTTAATHVEFQSTPHASKHPTEVSPKTTAASIDPQPQSEHFDPSRITTLSEDLLADDDDANEGILFPGEEPRQHTVSSTIPTPVQSITQPSAAQDESFSLFDDFPGADIDEPLPTLQHKQVASTAANTSANTYPTAPQTEAEDELEEESLFDDALLGPRSVQPEGAGKPATLAERIPHEVHYVQSDDAFFDGFADEDEFSGKVLTDLTTLQKAKHANYGRFVLQKKWSRAIDRKTLGLMNLEDNQDLLMIIPGKGLQEILPGGKKGKLIYEGEYELLGQPILGHVCMIRNQAFCVMQRGEFYESDWKFEDETLNLAISHDLTTVASFAGSTVTCRRWGGKLLWTGQFDRTGKAIFISFNCDGNLMICSYMGEDQAVHFFDQDGESLARFWMDAPIVSATPHHDRIGLWVITQTDDDVCMLYNVTQQHKRAICALEKPLHNLKASRDWLAGFDDNNQLHLIDLSVGLVMPLSEVNGTPIDIAVGKTTNELYILTTQDQVMRYVTALEIGFQDSDSRAIAKLDSQSTDDESYVTQKNRKSDQEPEALFAS
ncbi:MAG: serine/threonine-protein kinase [Sumerlaeia bacterium]